MIDYNKLTARAQFHVKHGFRVGQSFMNALFDIDPDSYDEITGTDSDCFYRDDLIPAFFKWLENKHGV